MSCWSEEPEGAANARAPEGRCVQYGQCPAGSPRTGRVIPSLLFIAPALGWRVGHRRISLRHFVNLVPPPSFATMHSPGATGPTRTQWPVVRNPLLHYLRVASHRYNRPLEGPRCAISSFRQGLSSSVAPTVPPALQIQPWPAPLLKSRSPAFHLCAPARCRVHRPQDGSRCAISQTSSPLRSPPPCRHDSRAPVGGMRRPRARARFARGLARYSPNIGSECPLRDSSQLLYAAKIS